MHLCRSKKNLAVLALNFFVAASAESFTTGDDILYAIVSTSGSTQDFGVIDPATDSFTRINQIFPTGLGWPLGDIASEPDPINGYFFTRQMNPQTSLLDILAIQKSDGSTKWLNVDGSVVGYDTKNNRLILRDFIRTETGADFNRILSYSIQDATSSVIASDFAPDNKMWQAGGIGAVDSFNRTAFQLGFGSSPKLYKVNLDTGNETNVNLAAPILSIAWDSKNQKLFGLYDSNENGQLRVAEINTATGELTNVGSANSIQGLSNYVQFIASTDQRYYIQQSPSEVVAISLIDGTVLGTFTAPLRLLPPGAVIMGSDFGDEIVNFNISDPDSSIIKLGSNRVDYQGDSVSSGNILIAEGALAINGDVGSAVAVVAEGATLGGSGTVGGIVNDGTLSPGNSIGTLNVEGDVLMNPRSATDIEIDPTGSSDKISASGIIRLDGSLTIIPYSGTYDSGTEYLILEGSQILGAFSLQTLDRSINSSFNLAYETFQQDGRFYIRLTEPVTLISDLGDVNFSTNLGPSAGVVTYSGFGVLSITGQNTHSSGFKISNGVLEFSSVENLGTGSIRLSDATIRPQSNLTISNPITLEAAGGVYETTNVNVVQSGVISGPGSLTKSGSGSVELLAENTYLGGTIVQAGTLILSNSKGASTGEVLMAADTVVQVNTTLALDNVFKLRGPVEFNTQGFDLTLNNTVSNNSVGQLIKTGSGILTLNGTNDYTGGTILQEGTLALYGSLASGVEVQSGTTFGGTGTVTGNVSNAGTIQSRLNGSRSTLKIVGNYVGQSGTFASTLGGTTAAIEADQLAIQGTGNVASGTTTIRVSDPTGVLGKPTAGDGILLVGVTAGATSTTTAFTAPRIAAGAYEYTLVRGGDSSSESWFLRANVGELQPPVIITPEAAQRQEVALYPSLPSLARQYLWSINGTLDDRRGAPEAIGQWDKQPIAWVRFIAQGNETKPGNANKGPGLKANDWGLQLGADLWRSDSAWGQWRVGPVATIGRSTGSANNATGSVKTGSVSLNAYSLGLNATVANHEGVYADLLLLGTRLTGVNANSPLGTSINTTGWAFSGSLEGGWRLPVTRHFALTPQAQVYVTTVDLNNSHDAYSLIQMPTKTTTVGRLGLKISYDNLTKRGGPQFWARASMFSTLSGKDAATTFLNVTGTNPTTFQSAAPSTWMVIDAAVNMQATKGTSVQVGLGYQTSFNDQYRGVYGQVNVKFAF